MQRATGLAVEFISSRDGVTQGSLAAWLNGNTEKHNRGRHDDKVEYSPGSSTSLCSQ